MAASPGALRGGLPGALRGGAPVGFAPAGFPLAGFAPAPFPPVGFAPAGFPPAGFPPAGFPPAGFPPVGFPPFVLAVLGAAPGAFVLFRFFEAQGEIRAAVSAIKSRTSAHERTIREFRLSAAGLQVGEALTELAEPVPNSSTAAAASTPRRNGVRTRMVVPFADIPLVGARQRTLPARPAPWVVPMTHICGL